MLTNRPKTKLLVDGGDPEETLRIILGRPRGRIHCRISGSIRRHRPFGTRNKFFRKGHRFSVEYVTQQPD